MNSVLCVVSIRLLDYYKIFPLIYYLISYAYIKKRKEIESQSILTHLETLFNYQ